MSGNFGVKENRVADHSAGADLGVGVETSPQEQERRTEEFHVTEFGLVLPNGDISWGQHGGRPLVTNQDRASIVDVIRQTAAELSFPEGELLSRYGWASRQVYLTKTYSVSHDGAVIEIDSPDALDVPVPTSEN